MACKRIYIFSVILIMVWSFDSVNSVFAQKNRKNKGKKEITEHTIRESEYLFIEAQKYYTLEDYAKSINLFLKCIDLVPNNSAAYYKLAQISIHNGEIDKALNYALKALELDKENKYFYLITANIYTEKGDFVKSAELYEQMISQIDGTNEYLFELAALYLYQNRLDDALSSYNRAEEVFGINEQAIHQKQKIYLQLNQLEKAIEEGEKLINAYPDESAYVIDLAEILIPNNRTKKAITLLEDLLLKFPENGQAKLILSDLYKNKGNLIKSEKYLFSAFDDQNVNPDVKVQIIASFTYQITQAKKINNPNITLEKNTQYLANKTIQLHPDDANAFAVYGDLLYALNDKKGALLNYLITVDLAPDNFQVWQNIFHLDSENNDLEVSIKHLETALELFPNQSIIYMYQGLALTQKKDFNEAIAILEQGKRLSSTNKHQTGIFCSLLGNAYNEIKEFDKSDESYEEAITINPNDYQTLNNYSYFLSLRKVKLDKAEKMAQKVVKNNPLNATYVDTYAWVLYATGKFKEAKKQMEKIIKFKDISAIHFDHYGDILFQLGDVKGAVEQWLRAKGMNPDLENIDKKIVDRRVYE
ncbi:MAG: tetratricopeptide repeat protein [Cyclobacteriaceae bacterium]|nr:tetratricopeptide repeat protein [Cyclobacteriaceae bacterium]